MPSGYFQQITNGQQVCKLFLQDEGIVGRVYDTAGKRLDTSAPLRDVNSVVAWFAGLYDGELVSLPIRKVDR